MGKYEYIKDEDKIEKIIGNTKIGCQNINSRMTVVLYTLTPLGNNPAVFSAINYGKFEKLGPIGCTDMGSLNGIYSFGEFREKMGKGAKIYLYKS